MALHTKFNSVWRTVSTFIKHLGTWKSTSVHIKHNGTWYNTTAEPPSAPTLSQTNNTNGTYSIDTTAFSTPSGSGTHISTDWQIAARTDTSFSSPVYQSLNDTSSKLSLAVQSLGLSDGVQYIARARHNSLATGDWSSSFDVFPPPAISMSSSAYNSHTLNVTSYTTSYTHSTSDYALTYPSDTNFTGTLAFNVTGQGANSYATSVSLIGNTAYRARVRANFSGGRTSAYKVGSVTTGNYTYTVTYTSNTTWTSPYGAGAGTASVTVTAAGSRAGGSCNSSGYGALITSTLNLPSQTNFYAYPNSISGGGGCACGGGGGAGSSFASTSNAAYLIAGGGGSVRQCCHCCACDCDGCGGGGGLVGGVHYNGTYGCGSADGASWGGSTAGTNLATGRGGSGSGGGTPCQGGSNYSATTPTTETTHTSSGYITITY